MGTVPKPRLTLQEYLKLEEISETRHEFFAGEVFEMEAATFRHQRIGSQLILALGPQLLAHGCEIQFSGTRVATSENGPFTYPDLVIVCGEPRFWKSDPDALANPKVIIEILSPTSADYDLGRKFRTYRLLTSLAEYVTVHQEDPLIEHHAKQSDGSWLTRDIHGLDAVLQLSSVPVEVPFSVIYKGIEF